MTIRVKEPQVSTRIRHKRVSSLTKQEYLACLHLNMHERGFMQSKLVYLRRYTDASAYVTLLEDTADRKLIAWGLCWNETRPNSKPTHLYVYTRYGFRRKGYGARVIKAIHSRHGRLKAMPWDYDSMEFFDAVRAHVKTRR